MCGYRGVKQFCNDNNTVEPHTAKPWLLECCQRWVSVQFEQESEWGFFYFKKKGGGGKWKFWRQTNLGKFVVLPLLFLLFLLLLIEWSQRSMSVQFWTRTGDSVFVLLVKQTMFLSHKQIEGKFVAILCCCELLFESSQSFVECKIKKMMSVCPVWTRIGGVFYFKNKQIMFLSQTNLRKVCCCCGSCCCCCCCCCCSCGAFTLRASITHR